MSEVEETAKAFGEGAKCVTKLVDSGDKIGGFLSNISGDIFADLVGIMIGDKLKHWRVSRINRMIDKYNENCEERGFSKAEPIVPKFSIPMIENASLEEDDNLQDIWCRLMVNNSDPDFEFEMRYAFIDIIKNLSFLDAQILEVSYNKAVKSASSYDLGYWTKENDLTEPEIFTDERFITYYTTGKENLLKTLNCEKNQLDISIDNLLRVQCFKDSSLETSVSLARNLKDVVCSDDRYSLTPLGVAFVEACIK